MFQKNKRKYVAVFCVQDSDNSFSVVKSMLFSPTQTHINFPIKEQDKTKKKPFIVDVSYPTYIKNNTLYYMFEKDAGQILLHKSKTNMISTEMMDDIFNDHVIRELAKATSDKRKDWFSLITFLALGGMLGSLITFGIMFFIRG